MKLPLTWSTALLEDVCDILDSQRIPINNTNRNLRIAGKDKSELFPYFGATGQVGVIDDYIFNGQYVLVGEDGAPFLDSSKNKSYMATGKFWVNNHAHILKSNFSNEFLCHFLNQFNYSDYVTGTTRLKLNQAALKSIPVIIPPLNEQKRIVRKVEELFSELDNGIASLKTAREQLKVYRQAVLKHAFEGKLTAQWRNENADKLETPEQLLARIQQEREAFCQQQTKGWKLAAKDWETKGKEGRKPTKPSAFKLLMPISEEETSVLPQLPDEWNYVRLAEMAFIGSGMSVSKERKLNDPVEVAYLRVANVQRGLLDLSEIKTMPVEKTSLPNLLLKKWDVLFNEGGDRDKLGRGWVWENQVEPCITQNHVFRATPYVNSSYHSKFISHWGNSFGQNYFEKGGKQTTNLASINKGVLSNFPIPLPTFDEQQLIITLLDDTMSRVDRFEMEIEQSLLHAETLRQSILKKAFSGQLVPQDSNDEPASELLARIKAEKETEKASISKKKPAPKRTRKLKEPVA